MRDGNGRRAASPRFRPVWWLTSKSCTVAGMSSSGMRLGVMPASMRARCRRCSLSRGIRRTSPFGTNTMSALVRDAVRNRPFDFGRGVEPRLRELVPMTRDCPCTAFAPAFGTPAGITSNG
jgi:hypothetical protein